MSSVLANPVKGNNCIVLMSQILKEHFKNNQKTVPLKISFSDKFWKNLSGKYNNEALEGGLHTFSGLRRLAGKFGADIVSLNPRTYNEFKEAIKNLSILDKHKNTIYTYTLNDSGTTAAFIPSSFLSEVAINETIDPVLYFRKEYSKTKILWPESFRRKDIKIEIKKQFDDLIKSNFSITEVNKEIYLHLENKITVRIKVIDQRHIEIQSAFPTIKTQEISKIIGRASEDSNFIYLRKRLQSIRNYASKKIRILDHLFSLTKAEENSQYYKRFYEAIVLFIQDPNNVGVEEFIKKVFLLNDFGEQILFEEFIQTLKKLSKEPIFNYIKNDYGKTLPFNSYQKEAVIHYFFNQRYDFVINKSHQLSDRIISTFENVHAQVNHRIDSGRYRNDFTKMKFNAEDDLESAVDEFLQEQYLEQSNYDHFEKEFFKNFDFDNSNNGVKEWLEGYLEIEFRRILLETNLDTRDILPQLEFKFRNGNKAYYDTKKRLIIKKSKDGKIIERLDPRTLKRPTI